MATSMRQVIEEFAALNERFVSGELSPTALERWSDLTDVVDGYLARQVARAKGRETRRRRARARLRLPARFFAVSGVGQAETVDLSSTGCAIESPVPIPPGARIELAVTLPGRLGTLHPIGQVRWTEADGLRGTWRAGVRFAGLADWEREVIASCVLGEVVEELEGP